MKIAILGYDTEGRASYEHFVRDMPDVHEVEIRDQDTNKEVPEAATRVLGETYLDDLDKFDLLVRTPGLRPRLILDKNPDLKQRITSGTNEFFRQCNIKGIRNIIGITGTKGKGTTSTLIAKMLETAGHTVHLGGNIGVPALALLPNIHPDDWVVLELSSFQLIDLQVSPRIAVCLMMAPEHQDWHSSIEEYYTAKEQLFAWQTPNDIAIYYHNNAISRRIADAGPAQKVPYYHVPGAEVTDDAIVIDNQLVCKTNELKLLGVHNWQNVCAAVTTVWYALRGVGEAACLPDSPVETTLIAAMKSVLTSFNGLEHRLEFVREVNNIKYYNDSFGTMPETVIVALQAFKQPKVAILGGSDKGASYDDLVEAVKKNNVRAVLLIGDQANRIKAALDAVGYHNYISGGDTMSEIVANAKRSAKAGDIVLLSTGCASFDMFTNYKDRGEQFKQAVAELLGSDPTV